MHLTMLKAKLHRARVTHAELGTRKVESIKSGPGRRREISVDMRAE